MKKSIWLFSVLLIPFILLPLVSCSPAVSAAPTSAPTQEPVQTAAPTVTLTPSPEPTPTLNPIEQKEAEVNQEIQDFLNAVGIYQDYKMDLGAFKFPDGKAITADLGIISDQLDIQGCLIDYIEKDDYIFLVTGFENKDKGRFVTVLAIARYFYEGRDSLFGFTEGPSTTDCHTIVEENYSHEVMLFYLNKLKGKVCGFYMTLNKTSEREFKSYGLDFDWVPRYVEEANNSTEFAKRLLNTVATNDFKSMDPRYVGIWKESIGKEPMVGLNRIDYESLSGLVVPFIQHQLRCKNFSSD